MYNFNYSKNVILLLLVSISTFAFSFDKSINIPGVTTAEIIRHVLFTESLAINPKVVSASNQASAVATTDLMTIMQKNTKWPLSTQLQNKVLNHPTSVFFKSLIDDNKYEISEILLTDKLGGLISAYPAPTDYWQGDENKFIMPLMKNDTHITDVSWDSSTKRYSYFVCIPIFNENNRLSGVLVVGVDVTENVIPDSVSK